MYLKLDFQLRTYFCSVSELEEEELSILRRDVEGERSEMAVERGAVVGGLVISPVRSAAANGLTVGGRPEARSNQASISQLEDPLALQGQENAR